MIGSSQATTKTASSPRLLRAWSAYAAASVVLTVVVSVVVTLVADDRTAKAVWLSAGLALVLQATAFALLLRFRDHAALFMAGWLGGMVLRFGTLALFMFWATRFTTLPRGPLLLSLVGFVFMLLLLEPVFLRWDLRRP